jgi:gamma-glutamylputrescine oxidase
VSDVFWLSEPGEPLPRRRLRGRPDVVVVGGGVTGSSCALELASAGARVRLLEARTIAGGASGRNGGFALRGGAMPYDAARLQLGAERACALWRLSEDALDELAPLAGPYLRRTGSFRLAADEDELTALEAEREALAEDGFAVERVELPGVLAERFPGAIRHPGDGALHPAAWVRRLARLATEAGAELVEGHRLERLEDAGADSVVVATDGYTRGLVPELDVVVEPTRGQVVATEPLAARAFEAPHYARGGFDYWHQLPDGRLVVGGWRDTDPGAEQTYEETVTPVIQRHIDAFIRELTGAEPRVTHRWSGIFGTTADRLPLAGRLPGRDGVWAACGYSGHGNVLGFACGRLVARAILGRPAPELELFDPARIL